MKPILAWWAWLTYLRWLMLMITNLDILSVTRQQQFKVQPAEAISVAWLNINVISNWATWTCWEKKTKWLSFLCLLFSIHSFRSSLLKTLTFQPCSLPGGLSQPLYWLLQQNELHFLWAFVFFLFSSGVWWAIFVFD